MRPYESFIGQPIRSLQTMLRVIAQDDNSYQTLIPDGIYGPETTAAVSIFQRKHGLPITGVTDLATWELIVSVYTLALVRVGAAQPIHAQMNPGQVIRKGERNANLNLAHAMLTILSEVYKSVAQPGQAGLMDEATADSIASFQGLSGLPMTGNLDKNTWQHLALQYPLAANLHCNLPK